MIAPARIAALRVCDLVESGEATLPDALAHSHAMLPDPRDRALAAEIATGVFRWRAALDHAIATHITRPIDRVDAVVLGILRISAYQLLFLDRVPARAVVDDAVSLTRQRKRTSAAGFVNAVLRKIAGSTREALLPAPGAPDYLTITLSHPRWLIDRWTARYGAPAAEAWARFNNIAAPLTLRANTLRTTREALAAQLAGLDVTTEPTPHAPDGVIVRGGHPLRTPLASAGLFAAQDEASQAVGWLAQLAVMHLTGADRTAADVDVDANTTLALPRAGALPAAPAAADAPPASHERPHATARGALAVLDTCAAPGGKTLALASALAFAAPAAVSVAAPASAPAAALGAAPAAAASRAQLVAADRRPRRMRLLRETLTTAGALCAPSSRSVDPLVPLTPLGPPRDGERSASVPAVRLVQLDLETGLPFREVFDLILVDAPCSGLGTLRREPEIRWRRTPADLAGFAERQQRMLREAATAVRAGGVLIYATCSSEPEENEAVAAAFLLAHPAFRAVDPRDWPLPAAAAALAALIDEAGHLRTLPHRDGLEAFFAAVFTRVA
jgi:16S rRNA (cytosine967-C5)-methyltransferase